MSANSANTYSSFDALNQRLDQIVREVADESLPLDDVLTLYEEAVNLGLRGCDLLEEGIQSYEEQEVAQEDGQDATPVTDAAPSEVQHAAQSEAPSTSSTDSSDAAVPDAGPTGGSATSASGSADASHRSVVGQPSEAQPQ